MKTRIWWGERIGAGCGHFHLFTQFDSILFSQIFIHSPLSSLLFIPLTHRHFRLALSPSYSYFSSLWMKHRYGIGLASSPGQSFLIFVHIQLNKDLRMSVTVKLANVVKIVNKGENSESKDRDWLLRVNCGLTSGDALKVVNPVKIVNKVKISTQIDIPTIFPSIGQDYWQDRIRLMEDCLGRQLLAEMFWQWQCKDTKSLLMHPLEI